MDFLPRLAAAATMAVTMAVTMATDSLAHRLRDDRGQTSTEYAGILFVIVAIIAALIALTWTDVGEAIKGKIVEAVGKLGS